jgi:hypothetical protein
VPPAPPGAGWMRVADVLADDAGAQAGDLRPLREIHLRSRHSSPSAASNRSSLRAQHRRQDRRTGGRPDRRHCARSHSVTRPRSVTTVARGRPWSGGPAVRWVGDGAGEGRSCGGPQRPVNRPVGGRRGWATYPARVRVGRSFAGEPSSREAFLYRHGARLAINYSRCTATDSEAQRANAGGWSAQRGLAGQKEVCAKRDDCGK